MAETKYLHVTFRICSKMITYISLDGGVAVVNTQCPGLMDRTIPVYDRLFQMLSEPRNNISVFSEGEELSAQTHDFFSFSKQTSEGLHSDSSNVVYKML